jgi:hypothetical protein
VEEVTVYDGLFHFATARSVATPLAVDDAGDANGHVPLVKHGVLYLDFLDFEV